MEHAENPLHHCVFLVPWETPKDRVVAGLLLSPGPQPVAPSKYMCSECQRCAARLSAVLSTCSLTGPHRSGHGKGRDI